MSDKIKSVKHIVNERTGETDDEGNEILQHIGNVEYDFAESVSDEAQKAVENHVPTLTRKEDIEKIIEQVEE